MVCNILSIVFEDFVQLVITFVHIDAIDFGDETGVNQAMTIISVLFAFGTLGERLYTVVSQFKMGVMPALFDADQPALLTAKDGAPNTLTIDVVASDAEVFSGFGGDEGRGTASC